MKEIAIGIFVNTAIIVMVASYTESFVRDQYYYKYTSKRGRWVLALNIVIVMGAIIYFTYQFNDYWWLK